MSVGAKYRVKHGIKRLAIASGLEVANALRTSSLAERARGRGVIFTLHHVRPQLPASFRPNALLEITPEFLDTVLHTLRAEGYEPIPLDEVPSRLRSDDGKRFAAFTLDDGYHDNAIHAAPVFSKHNAPFSVFVSKGLSERSHTLWWETLEALVSAADDLEIDIGDGPMRFAMHTDTQKIGAFETIGGRIIAADEQERVERLNAKALEYGIDANKLTENLVLNGDGLKALAENPLASLGAHTISHRAIGLLEREEALREMRVSADYVEGITGKRPKAFAYPYGFAPAVTPRDHELALEAGFEMALTTQPGTLTKANLDNMTALPRISLNGLYQKARFVSGLMTGLPFKLSK